jgi:hypothetical protein
MRGKDIMESNRNRIPLQSAAWLAIFSALFWSAVPSRLAAADGPVYVPPLRGAPTIRVGGGTRGDDLGVPLDLLAPDHTGWSGVAQPRLYWKLSAPLPPEYQVNLVITGLRSATPLVDAPITPSQQAGLQAINLADHGVQLAPQQSYRWSLVLQAEAETTAEQPLVVSGMIRHVPPTPEQLADTQGDTPLAQAESHCSASYWYDCIDALAGELIQNPDASGERAAMESLLAQLNDRPAGF